MSTPFYVSPEQLMKDRADFARKGIARGRSVVVIQYADGILFVSENPSQALHKVSEIYDRIAFAAVGRYNEFENLRIAGVRLADMRGYAYDRRDVTGRGLANAYAQTLGRSSPAAARSPTRSRSSSPRWATPPADDQVYRLTYDGQVADEHGFAVMGGAADVVAGHLKEHYVEGATLQDAVRLAVAALGHSESDDRVIPTGDLEVAVLDRTRAAAAQVRPAARVAPRRAAGRARTGAGRRAAGPRTPRAPRRPPRRPSTTRPTRPTRSAGARRRSSTRSPASPAARRRSPRRWRLRRRRPWPRRRRRPRSRPTRRIPASRAARSAAARTRTRRSRPHPAPRRRTRATRCPDHTRAGLPACHPPGRPAGVVRVLGWGHGPADLRHRERVRRHVHVQGPAPAEPRRGRALPVPQGRQLGPVAATSSCATAPGSTSTSAATPSTPRPSATTSPSWSPTTRRGSGSSRACSSTPSSACTTRASPATSTSSRTTPTPPATPTAATRTTSSAGPASSASSPTS